MLFNSVEYFVLLAVTLLAYWLTPALALRQAILLVASVVFYVSWSPPYLLLLAALIAATHVAVWLHRRFRIAIPVLVALALAVLGFVKYADFALRALADLTGASARGEGFAPLHIVLPLGISFYIFQLIAYAVDVKRGDYREERNPLLLALFVMFFPHLIAGPICRPAQLLPQLRTLHRFEPALFVQGFLTLACGLFLKIAIADNISPFVDRVFDAPAQAAPLECLAGALLFGVVIFCDFWGYSTMAVGAAMMFGITLPQNFRLPYAARSLQDFWRRWHITLSNWLRDYLYKPLGGSRIGPVRTYVNLLVVMVLGGLWHGAAYTFLIWGALHGGWLAVERAFTRATAGFEGRGGAAGRIVAGAAGWLVTMTVVFVAWVFFRASSVEAALAVLDRATTPGPLRLTPALRETLPWLALFLLVHVPIHWLIWMDPAGRRPTATPLGTPLRAVLACWVLLVALLLGEGQVESFIYFQF